MITTYLLLCLIFKFDFQTTIGSILQSTIEQKSKIKKKNNWEAFFLHIIKENFQRRTLKIAFTIHFFLEKRHRCRFIRKIVTIGSKM